MSVRDYLKMVAAEYALLLVASTSLAYTTAAAFLASGPYADGFAVPLAVCAVLLAALFAIAYSKKALLTGGVALAVVLLAAFVVGIVGAGGANAFVDAEGNTFLYLVIVVLTAGLSFALTRARMLSLVFVVAGCFVCALVEFLFEEHHTVAALVFVAACMALVVYQNYCRSLKGTVSKKASFPAATATSVVAALVAGLLALGVASVVIFAIAPPAAEIKLFTEYRAYEELPRRGINAELSITDPDLESVLTNDSTTAAQQNEDSENEQEADERDGSNQNPLAASLQSLGSAMGYSADGAAALLNLITFNLPWWGWIGIVCVIIAIIAVPILIKLALRRRFYRHALSLSPRDYTIEMYERIIADMGRMGMRRTGRMTPYEFAEATERDMTGFAENEKQANFSLLTVAFMQASFSNEPLTSNDLIAYHSFWKSFYKNCRAFVGTPRYILLFFKL